MFLLLKFDAFLIPTQAFPLILLFSITSYISPSIRCSATSCPEGTRTTRRSKQSIIGQFRWRAALLPSRAQLPIALSRTMGIAVKNDKIKKDRQIFAAHDQAWEWCVQDECGLTSETASSSRNTRIIPCLLNTWIKSAKLAWRLRHCTLWSITQPGYNQVFLWTLADVSETNTHFTCTSIFSLR